VLLFAPCSRRSILHDTVTQEGIANDVNTNYFTVTQNESSVDSVFFDDISSASSTSSLRPTDVCDPDEDFLTMAKERKWRAVIITHLFLTTTPLSGPLLRFRGRLAPIFRQNAPR
jgi:hypothetical protein